MRNVKILSKLIQKLNYELINGRTHGNISQLVEDTRKVTKGCLFVCIKGAVYDAHEHIDEIIAGGAKVIVVEKGNIALQEFLNNNKRIKSTIIAVDNTKSALAHLAAAYYDHPADKLKVIGVTGTKGKTTTTYMVKSILENAGINVGLIGTIEITYGDVHISSVNTTPGSFLLQEHFARMVDAGVEVCVMEVSSQAYLLNRVDGFTFEIGVFTNISPDHIGPNEHSSFENYLECKSMLFKQCRYALVNGDDEHAGYIMDAANCPVLTYGMGEGNDLLAYNMKLYNENGMLGVEYEVKGRINKHARVSMPGKFSVYNSLCAMAICYRLGVDIEVTLDAISQVKVKGRTQMMDVPGDYTLMIDYAHNAVSLKSLLESLREYKPKRLVVLFGCGGNRAKGRRYSMGSVAARYADLSIITSDNPRDEEPHEIIRDILAGYALGTKGDDAKNVEELTREEVEKLISTLDYKNAGFIEIDDRVQAIGFIMLNAKKGDLVVLAGKGHEDYQIIKGEKLHLDETEVVADIAKGIVKNRKMFDKIKGNKLNAVL